MYRCLLLFLLLCPYNLKSQIFPKEDSRLNFRLIGFSFPAENKTGKCALEIARGRYNSADSFEKNIIKIVACKTNNVIGEVPAFGSEYTWRTMYTGKRKKTISGLHHFSTGTSARIDTATSRLRIIKKAEKYKDAYVFIDETAALYDLSGHPVWFLPDMYHKVTEGFAIRDIKLTPQGTVTFLSADNIFEVNYTGDVLWKGPNTGAVSGDSAEHYHHEFSRLANGHYMALGNQSVSCDLPNYRDVNELSRIAPNVIKDSNNKFHQNMQFGTVIEYDETGKVVWSWKSLNYFKNSDLYDPEIGLFEVKDPHQNSFFFDEQNNYLYIGFRDISRIVRVKYPEGTVSAAYGTKYTFDSVELGNDMFNGQHSIKRSKKGYLYVFNNNGTVSDNLPKIDMMLEPFSPKGTLKKIWEYQCNLDGMTEWELKNHNKQIEQKIMTLNQQKNENKIKYKKKLLTAGGNAIELPDESIFVSMNGLFSKIFIVSLDKKIIWESILEKRDTKQGNWNQQPTYRASIISNRDDLEHLIRNAETDGK